MLRYSEILDYHNVDSTSTGHAEDDTLSPS